MVDLILRPSGLPESMNKPWSLQLRDHGPAETTYETLCRVSDETAQAIFEAGGAFWLFGEPDWEERCRAKDKERARQLREKADELDGVEHNGMPEVRS